MCGVGQKLFSMLKEMIKIKRDSKYDDQEDYRESVEANWIFFCNLLQAVLSILNFCWSIAGKTSVESYRRGDNEDLQRRSCIAVAC